MHTQFADLAYKLIENSPTRGADAENVAAVRQWLRQIGKGELVVGAPVKKKPRKAPEAAK